MVAGCTGTLTCAGVLDCVVTVEVCIGSTLSCVESVDITAVVVLVVPAAVFILVVTVISAVMVVIAVLVVVVVDGPGTLAVNLVVGGDANIRSLKAYKTHHLMQTTLYIRTVCIYNAC